MQNYLKAVWQLIQNAVAHSNAEGPSLIATKIQAETNKFVLTFKVAVEPEYFRNHYLPMGKISRSL